MADYECPFKVGDMVIPVKPSNRLEGPNWASGMDDMEGSPYCIYNIAQSQNGYYLIRIGDEPDERSWKFMDKWLRPIDYTLF